MAPGVWAMVCGIAPFEFFSSVFWCSLLLHHASKKNSRVPEALSRPTTTMIWSGPPTVFQFVTLPV